MSDTERTNRRREERYAVEASGWLLSRRGVRRVRVVDLSAAGCRVSLRRAACRGERVWLWIRPEMTGCRRFRVAGRIVHPGDSAGMTFTRIPRNSRKWLHACLTGDLPKATAKPDRRGERRGSLRRRYESRVHTLGTAVSHLLVARDLSPEGMRVDPLPHLHVGQTLRVSIPLPVPGPPAVLDATIARIDGPRGVVLRFAEISAEHRAGLEALLAMLPPLQDGRREGVILAAIDGGRA